MVSTHIFVEPVLVDGPDRGHVGVEELRQRGPPVARPGTDEPGLAHGVVAHQHALDQLPTRAEVVIVSHLGGVIMYRYYLCWYS